MPHLFVAVTAHGYGHLAQCAPVAEALAERTPGMRLTLQGNLDAWFVRKRLPSCNHLISEPADVGLLMDGPLRTRWSESLLEYERFEAEYDRRLRSQIEIFEESRPDLVLADVPWLPLDAAKVLDIPAVAICSLSWYDILAESPVADRMPAAVADRLRSVYAAADMFIRPAPSMPMAWLPNARDTGPIALSCPDLSRELRDRAGIPYRRPLVLVQFGGFDGFDPLQSWPEQDQVQWLVPTTLGNQRADTLSLDKLGLGVRDVLGSCDAILTKPGYGTVTEAACNAKPVLYISRGDWPEEPTLIDWLKRQVSAQEISMSDLIAGSVIEPLFDLLASEPSIPVPPTGIGEVVELLEPLLVRK